MSLALYMDENLPWATTAGLRQRGVDVLTVQEDGRNGIADPLILDRAGELGRILVTQDTDFLAESAQRLQRGQKMTGIVFHEHAASSIRQVIDDPEIIARVMTAEEMSDVVVYLPL